ncbi:Flagellar biosynthetic protein FlhB [Saliniradius amylolyticus]|uniref:Flagellar biosynthetic protein FlhB n=1 Tax=Saliniradius amylolyticus TaxID=2183582 RepID=A0A2S2E5N8_9ALTE|nr:flagellar biosynthesis protein FlhB [Saliniradius amylolyticus]AWL12550.1 Flagellar biosynthetic protein FlhB [Saliniradius amylolyticus]
MAEESAAEKTEEPTEKKIKKAREKGQIARSKELPTTAVLIGAAVCMVVFGHFVATALYRAMERTFTLSRDEVFDTKHMFQALGAFVGEVAFPLAMILIILMVVGIVASTILGGFNFSWKAAAPQFNKLNPINGFKRMFGPNGLVELVKALGKFLLVAVSAVTAMMIFQNEAIHLDQEVYPRNIFHALELVSWVFLIICCAMIPIVALDVPYQSYKHNKEMKMTKQEVKDEHKNQEGDPQIKGKQRQLQMQASARRMMQQVPEADVVVTNPTHYSVALKYEEDGERAPILVAKGADELALHIRKIATAHEVPIIESPMLARSIYHSTDENQEVPEKLFMAVAQVLAYVYQMKQWRKGRGKRPKPLAKDLPIPPDMRH